MTEKVDFESNSFKLSLITPLLMELPLEEMMSEMQTLQTTAPIFNPTAYIQGHKTLEENMEIVGAFLECKKRLEKVRQRKLEAAASGKL